MGILPDTSSGERLQSGQALLVVLLAMAVILTVVLSVTSRSVIDVTTTGYQEDALRAFSAAEAGVEQALFKQQNVSNVLDPNANVSFDAQIGNPLPGIIYNYPSPLTSGEIATFWFVSHNNTTYALTCATGVCTRASQLAVCFGNNPAASPAPAIEISVYYDSSQQSFANPNNFTNLKVVRTTRDPSATRRLSNHFGAASAGCAFGGGYSFQSGAINLTSLIPSPPNCAVNSSNCLVMAKVRVLYNSSPQPVGLRVTGSANLPAQGFQIDSTGTSKESVRNLSVSRSFPEPQSVFDSAVFSRNGLTKP